MLHLFQMLEKIGANHHLCYNQKEDSEHQARPERLRKSFYPQTTMMLNEDTAWDYFLIMAIAVLIVFLIIAFVVV